MTVCNELKNYDTVLAVLAQVGVAGHLFYVKQESIEHRAITMFPKNMKALIYYMLIIRNGNHFTRR